MPRLLLRRSLDALLLLISEVSPVGKSENSRAFSTPQPRVEYQGRSLSRPYLLSHEDAQTNSSDPATYTQFGGVRRLVV